MESSAQKNHQNRAVAMHGGDADACTTNRLYFICQQCPRGKLRFLYVCKDFCENLGTCPQTLLDEPEHYRHSLNSEDTKLFFHNLRVVASGGYCGAFSIRSRDGDKSFNLILTLVAYDEDGHAIIKALEETRWNRTAAARKLGMSLRSLRYRLEKLGIE